MLIGGWNLRGLTRAVEGAIRADALSREQLALINPYQANLKASWLFQRSMRPPAPGRGEFSEESTMKTAPI